jgi:FkbM family methyltransferase
LEEKGAALMHLPDLSSTTVLGRAARFPLRILPPTLTVPILAGELKGKKWIVGSQRHACWLGIYEFHLQKVVAQELRPGGVFYDVGANVGFYSLLASKRIGSGKVFAFEPLPKNVRYLERHLRLNGIQNVDVLEVAVSNETGTSFFQSESTRAMGRLQQDGGNFRVQTATLDSLLQEGRIAPPDSIKMDVEGAEGKALLGAQLCFERYKPKLFLATHGKDVHDACCRLLGSWDYEFRLLGKPQEDRAELFASPRTP